MHVAAKALIPSLMGLAVIDVVEGTVPFQPGHGQFTASRPQQNTATTTSVITKHCCQMYHMCSPGNSLTSHLSPATTLATSWTSMFVFNTIHSVSSSCVPLANHTTHSVKILTKNVWGANRSLYPQQSPGKNSQTILELLQQSTALKTHLFKDDFE